MKIYSLARGAFLFSLCLGLARCGDGGSSFESELSEVSLVTNPVAANTTTTLKVRFFVGGSPDSGDSFSSAPFSLIVFVPRGASYEDGSSKLSDSFFGDSVFGRPDMRDPDQIGRCSDGREYLYYRFSSNEFGDPTALDSFNTYIQLKLLVTAAAQGERAEAVLHNVLALIADPCNEEGGVSEPIAIK